MAGIEPDATRPENRSDEMGPSPKGQKSVVTRLVSFVVWAVHRIPRWAGPVVLAFAVISLLVGLFPEPSAVIGPPLVGNLANFVIPAVIYVIVALGLNLQFGETGVFNAGVAAFIGVGAYSFAMLTTGYIAPSSTYPGHWGLPVPIDLIPAAIISMGIAGVAGVLIAAPTLRLRADYLAIATLALAEIIRLVFKEELRITGGDQTLPLIPRPFAGIIPSTQGWASDGAFMAILVVILLVTLVFVEYLTRLPWGRALRAVREDEEAAMALGKNAFRLKLTSFGIGCMVMGLAGALTAMYSKVISPERFNTFITFNAYVIVILGGRGNSRGVVLGGFIFWLFTWGTQYLKTYLPLDWALRIDFVNLIVVGLILILFILIRPEGIIPEEKFTPTARRR